MKLIIGLGNPGLEYNNTRHNIGFMALDSFVNEKYSDVLWKKKFNGLYFDTAVDGEKVIFLKPQSYMNLSGTVVKKYVDFYKINISDILVISDDLDLLVGNYRLRDGGSCGGHNGLLNIEENLGTNKYKRLKIGISNNKDINTKDYVLGKISKEDLKVYKDLFAETNNVIDDYFKNNFSGLMNKYNRKNR